MKKALVYSPYGQIVGRMEPMGGEIYVYNANGVYQGRTANGKTYDKNGVMVAIGEIPGLLLKSKLQLPIEKSRR